MKKIVIHPGKRLSYQEHLKRGEFWRIVEGTGKLTIDGKEEIVHAWEAIEIPPGLPHRIENAGTDPLVFIEIQRGEYLAEDDIVRLEDDYGRIG